MYVFARSTILCSFTLALSLVMASCAAQVASDGDLGEGATPSHDGVESQAQQLTAAACACSLPTSGLYATFRVGTETFSQQITTSTAMADAIAVWRGQSNKRIPTGQLACQCTGWNCQWRFRIRPETLVMANAAIELCDGMPSYVDSHCPTFGGGQYCPWQAQLIDLRDCRFNRACPRVPR